MTFKNKHSFISGFLGAALLIASGCALGGCTEIADEPQGIDDAGNGTPLTIRATASGFVSCVQGDTPATRTPTENGYTTEFNDGDAIGIFALKEYATPDVTPVDGVYNLKLVYTKAADGSGSWAPASGDTHVLYNYDDDLVYVAYYPYREGITIKQDIETEIFKDLAANAKLQPAADQSTPAAYTGSDLMAAFARPATDPTDANKKVLTLAFEHLHALLVFKPSEGFLRYVSPDGGFEYRDEARELLGSQASEVTINNVKACPMGNGSFRAIIPTSLSAASFTPSGKYILTDGKTLNFTGSPMTAGTLTAGRYYTIQTNTQLGTKIRGLQSGDFFYRDGKLLNRDINTIPDPTNCVGILITPAGGSDSNYGGNCVNNTVHGQVVSVYDVVTCKWGPNGNIGTNTSDSWNDWRGYQLTQKMKQDADANYGGLSADNYAAAYYCLNYGNTDKGKLTAVNNSGWYFPSEGFMYSWAILRWGDINASLTKLVSAGYGQNIGSNQYYWDASTANSDSQARIVKLNSGSMGYVANRDRSYRVRAVLTF